MQWEQVVTIIGVNAAIVGLLAGWITWVINRVDYDVKVIANKMDALSSRMDSRFESQSVRTDKLYEVYVNTQKDIFELRADFNQKFYELIKEGKK